jgi:hypothetical protein
MALRAVLQHGKQRPDRPAPDGHDRASRLSLALSPPGNSFVTFSTENGRFTAPFRVKIFLAFFSRACAASRLNAES